VLGNRWRCLLHLGWSVHCPLCGWRFRHFRDDWNRGNAICWRCGSHERHRALWLFFETHIGLLEKATSLLHFAPEWCLEHRLRRRKDLRYVTADFLPGLGDLQLDLTRLDLPDASFDAVICSHVLEHVSDDRAAMGELRRVLSGDGWAVVMVPIDHARQATYEDPLITTPEERERAYWQKDHVRLYAPDVVGRLAEAGLVVESHSMVDELGRPAALRHGLLDVDHVLLCRRSNADGG
jgi:SAM-dependent methyltransferase